MLFQANYKDLQDHSYGPLPEGDYEFVIKSVAENATKSGAESIQFNLVVRNDLDQAMPETNGKYHNRQLWVDEWKRRATNQYEVNNLMYFMQAAGIPEGTPINTIEDFYQIMTGKPVRIHITVEDNTYNGKTTQVNRPAPWDWQQTKFPQVNHQWKQGTQPLSGAQMPTNGKNQTFTMPQQPAGQENFPF